MALGRDGFRTGTGSRHADGRVPVLVLKRDLNPLLDSVIIVVKTIVTNRLLLRLLNPAICSTSVSTGLL